MRLPVDVAFLLRPYPITPGLSVDGDPYQLGCIPFFLRICQLYPHSQVEQQRKRLPIYKHRLQILHAVPLARCFYVTGVHQKRDRATYLSRILLMFSPSFPGSSRFPTSLTLFGGVSFYILHIDNMSRLMICQWKNHQKRRIYQTNMGRTGALTKWNWLAKGVHQLAVCDVKTFDWSDCDPSRRLPLGAFGNQSFSDAEHESYLNWWWINHQHPLNPYYNTY